MTDSSSSIAVPVSSAPELNASDGKAATRNSMWGGRFSGGPAAIMARINNSLGFDQRLWAEDIAGSRAHAAMLAACGIIGAADEAAIQDGLGRVEAEIKAGAFPFRPELEDIHMNIEARLAELIGDAAKRLHTARSRNDQVATDFRLWVRAALARLDEGLQAVQAALIAQAEAHTGTLMPGFTHMQTAQPVTFGHHLLAYVEMLGRDRSRAQDAARRLNECPLGAAALAGTGFPIDRHMTAKALGFDRPMANSLDAVSDRDFALDYLSVCAIAATHLSRLAEEIILWCSGPFRFITLSDAFTTGSSIMPQKRNPDAAELVRGKTGRMIGALTGLLVVVKALPLAYAKDLQEDKEAVFETDDTMALCLAAMSGMIGDLKANPAAMLAALAHGHATATDLADWLVRVAGMPFRNAHHVTGTLTALADQKGCRLDELSLAEMKQVEAAITDDIYNVLTLQASVASRTSFGGTAPERVRQAAAAAQERFL